MTGDRATGRGFLSSSSSDAVEAATQPAAAHEAGPQPDVDDPRWFAANGIVIADESRLSDAVARTLAEWIEESIEEVLTEEQLNTLAARGQSEDGTATLAWLAERIPNLDELVGAHHASMRRLLLEARDELECAPDPVDAFRRLTNPPVVSATDDVPPVPHTSSVVASPLPPEPPVTPTATPSDVVATPTGPEESTLDDDDDWLVAWLDTHQIDLTKDVRFLAAVSESVEEWMGSSIIDALSDDDVTTLVRLQDAGDDAAVERLIASRVENLERLVEGHQLAALELIRDNAADFATAVDASQLWRTLAADRVSTRSIDRVADVSERCDEELPVGPSLDWIRNELHDMGIEATNERALLAAVLDSIRSLVAEEVNEELDPLMAPGALAELRTVQTETPASVDAWLRSHIDDYDEILSNNVDIVLGTVAEHADGLDESADPVGLWRRIMSAGEDADDQGVQPQSGSDTAAPALVNRSAAAEAAAADAILTALVAGLAPVMNTHWRQASTATESALGTLRKTTAKELAVTEELGGQSDGGALGKRFACWSGAVSFCAEIERHQRGCSLAAATTSRATSVRPYAVKFDFDDATTAAAATFASVPIDDLRAAQKHLATYQPELPNICEHHQRALVSWAGYVLTFILNSRT